PSEKEEHFFLERMLAREIQDTLQKLPSVRLARVHIYFPVIESIAVQKRDTQNGSASVLIVTSETQIVDVNQIKNIVAGATGLEQNQILVNISKSEDFVERASDLSKQPNSFNYFRLIWVLFGGCIVIITSTYVFRKRTKL
ncbi:MAG: hypothetical protein NZO16_04520, partial [Deltaproteobacteria bacterium]|nr:hypothetical protein [Deltaproteobacteria bacterium]